MAFTRDQYIMINQTIVEVLSNGWTTPPYAQELSDVICSLIVQKNIDEALLKSYELEEPEDK